MSLFFSGPDREYQRAFELASLIRDVWAERGYDFRFVLRDDGRTRGGVKLWRIASETQNGTPTRRL